MIYTSLWKACYLCPGARPHLQAWKVQAEVLCDLAILFILFGMSVGMVMEDSPSLLFATFFKFKLKKIRLQEAAIHEGLVRSSSWVAFGAEHHGVDQALWSRRHRQGSVQQLPQARSWNKTPGHVCPMKLYVHCPARPSWENHLSMNLMVYKLFNTCICRYTSSTAQGGGGSFKIGNL